MVIIQNNTNISLKQAIFLMSIFLLGDTDLFINGIDIVKQDIWIVQLIGVIIGILLTLLLVYIFMKSRTDLSETLEISFGKPVGKVITNLYILYFLLLCAIDLSNISQFINVLVLPEQIKLIISGVIIILCSYAVLMGIESISRAGEVVFISLIITGLFLIGLSISNVEPGNILPILNSDYKSMLHAISIYSVVPFGQSIVLLALLPLINAKLNSLYKVSYSILVSGFFIIAGDVLAVLIFTPEFAANFTYPVSEMVRTIQIGRFLQRLDTLSILIWLSLLFIKISLLFYIIISLLEKTFSLHTRSHFIVPVGLLIYILSLNIYNNDIDKQQFGITAFPIISIPFQYVIPIIIAVILSIKMRKAVNTNN